MQALTYMYFYVELVYARQARKESQNETLARSDSFDRRRYACEASEESEGSSDGVSDDSINFGARAREWRVDADGGADGGSHASEPASAKQSGDDFFSVSCMDAIELPAFCSSAMRVAARSARRYSSSSRARFDRYRFWTWVTFLMSSASPFIGDMFWARSLPKRNIAASLSTVLFARFFDAL